MATQALRVYIIADLASTSLIKRLIEGCQLNDIGGVCVIEGSAYAAQKILEELHQSGLDVQLPSFEETGTGLVKILMYVPDEQRERVDTFRNKYEAAIDRWDWGVQIGDMVLTPDPEPTDSFQYQFAGTVVGFRCAFAQVEDMGGDVFDIEPFRLAYFDRNSSEDLRTLIAKELPELSERYWKALDAKENSSKTE